MVPRLAQGKWRNTLRIARNALSLNCIHVVAARNQMRIWGCSPPQKMLKLWNPILLRKPRITQKDFLKWPTPKNRPLEDPHNPSSLCAAVEMNPPQLCLKLSQNPPICKGWSPAQPPSTNPPANLQSRTAPRNNCVIPLKTAQSSKMLNPPAKMLMKLLQNYWWKYLARAGTRSPPGLRVRFPNGDTQCTKQCCKLAKQPTCSKSKWPTQMHIIECQNEEASLSFIALAFRNPKAHLLQRSFPLATCFSPSVQSLHVFTWVPPLCGSLAHLGSPFKLQRCATRECLYSWSEYVPLSSPFYL